MDKINTIELRDTLPCVFTGEEGVAPVSNSQVWLHDISLQRPDRYLVMAESGTGKSSLCSYIYGNRSDYRGTILFDGRDIRTLSVDDWCQVRRRHIALLPQEMRLFAELTVYENIIIKNRLTDRYSHAEIMELLAELEVDHKADQLAGRLSIGQQQRVAIVRALCQPFDFIILDEPVSHLDERNNAAVAALVTRVATANDAAIVATSVGNHLKLADPKVLHL